MFSPLISQVAENCELASCHQAGSFSLCGLLMRLRLLYKWQHALPPWQEPEPEGILAWIADLENTWDAREGEPWQELRVNGLSLDPFEAEKVNSFLQPGGLAYGAGLCRGLAPTFFLGELSEVRREEDLTIFVLDRELARDLDGTPAMRQGSVIYARRQSLAYYLWDRLADPSQQDNRFLNAGWSSSEASLAALLKDPVGHKDVWDTLISGEMEAVIRHEIGEARETSLDQAFPAILELFPQTPLEQWIRAVKDALADMNDQGRLHYFISGERLPALALMLAFQPGFYPLLLPELEPAFFSLTASGDWGVMEEARQSASARLRQVATELTHLLEVHKQDDPENLRQVLTSRFLTPLGL
ncbi:MAG: Sfum_1244 family protein [Desulfobaccales bacterium]